MKLIPRCASLLTLYLHLFINKKLEDNQVKIKNFFLVELVKVKILFFSIFHLKELLKISLLLMKFELVLISQYSVITNDLLTGLRT